MQQFWPSSFVQSAVGVFLIAVEFILPPCILFYCYGRILWILTRRLDTTFGNNESQAETFKLARRNTLKTFILVGLSFIICWSADQIYFLLYNLGYDMGIGINIDHPFIKFIILMVFINCTINPFIYLLNYKDYQEALRFLLRCKSRNDKDVFETKSGYTTTSSDS